MGELKGMKIRVRRGGQYIHPAPGNVAKQKPKSPGDRPAPDPKQEEEKKSR